MFLSKEVLAMQVTPSPIAQSRNTRGVSASASNAPSHSPKGGKARHGNLNSSLEKSQELNVDLTGQILPGETGNVFQAVHVAVLFNACLGIAGLFAYEVWRMIT